jgi:methionyl aminopeptidase
MTLDTAEDTTVAPIRIHRPEDFEGMRRAGRLAAECLDMLVAHVKPGVATDAIDTLAREFILDHGALPACLGYKGYTRTTCISRNHVVCHGIPGGPANQRLNAGDVANIDVTVIVDGWHGDTSRMYPVGDISPKARRLLDVTHTAMEHGIAAVRPGASFADIGLAIQTHAEGQRCSIVRDFCGHGVGQVFHDAPNVLHYRARDQQGRWMPTAMLKPGMFFTIEPMVNLGRPDVKVLGDGWTAVTKDKSLVGAVRALGRGHRGRGGGVHPLSRRLDKPGSEPWTPTRRSLARPPPATATAFGRGPWPRAARACPTTSCWSCFCSARSRRRTSSRSPRRCSTASALCQAC